MCQPRPYLRSVYSYHPDRALRYVVPLIPPLSLAYLWICLIASTASPHHSYSLLACDHGPTSVRIHVAPPARDSLSPLYYSPFIWSSVGMCRPLTPARAPPPAPAHACPLRYAPDPCSDPHRHTNPVFSAPSHIPSTQTSLQILGAR